MHIHEIYTSMAHTHTYIQAQCTHLYTSMAHSTYIQALRAHTHMKDLTLSLHSGIHNFLPLVYFFYPKCQMQSKQLNLLHVLHVIISNVM